MQAVKDIRNALRQFDQLVEKNKERNIKIDKDIDIDALMNEMNNAMLTPI